MKMHANARLSLKGRELLIERVENAGWSLIVAGFVALSVTLPPIWMIQRSWDRTLR